MWAVGLNQSAVILFATLKVEGGYGLSIKGIGFLFFAPVVAVIIGELFGNFANDAIAARYVQRHGGEFKPEARLPSVYVSSLLIVPGLVLVGQALRKHLTVVAIIFGWGMYVCGYMIQTVGITAYALDSYPNAPGEVSALIGFARLIGGFSVGYFQLDWAKRSGFDGSFGAQAGIAAAGFCIIPVLHIYGPSMRARAGPLTN